MQTNIMGASGKVNYFEADLILTNHSQLLEAHGSPLLLMAQFFPPSWAARPTTRLPATSLSRL
jgi:hypothetical protein